MNLVTSTLAAVIAMGSWWSSVRAQPIEAAAALIAIFAATCVGALVLQRANQRSRSLRRQVLAVTLAALVIGAGAAVLLARLMVLSSSELHTVLGLLGLTAVFAVLLVLVAIAPLGRDVDQLEGTVRKIEQGDRSARTTIVRTDELGLVARALNDLNARLETLERERAGYEQERAAMLSSVGHDLRTPLAALRAAVEALADGVAPDPDRYLTAMLRDVEALSALVDDLFLLSRIEAGRVELHPVPVDLTEVVDEAVEAMAPTAEKRGVTVQIEATDRVHARGNPTTLGRVVRNLLDNAIRHAPAGSIVTISVRGDGRPTVRVVDAGPGFPTGFAAHAFDRFSRADESRTRATGGAGLGLAIARGLVEAHGGRIWIDEPSHSGGGRITFDLPPLDARVTVSSASGS